MLPEQENLRREADTWFIVSLIAIVCCCVFGIIGAILAYQAKDLIAQQRYEEARSKVQAAKIIAIVGVSLGLLLPLLQLVLSLIGFAMSF